MKILSTRFYPRHHKEMKGRKNAHIHPKNFSDGPAWWSKLHLRALALIGDDTEWLADFSRHLPCGPCRRDWRAFLSANPPRWGDYFAWTVEAHNAINRRLDKPELSIEEARRLWELKS